MTMRDDRTRLLHVRDHLAEAVALLGEKSRAELEADRLLNLSLVRLLEIAAQSAARVSEETQRGLLAIPWPDLAGLRDRLLHGYDTVDLDILWHIVHDDLPPLVEQIQQAATA